MTTYPEPVVLTGGQRIEAFARFGIDPIAGSRWIRNRHGSFVVFRDPFSSRGRSYGLVSDPELYRELVTDERTWRNVSVTLKGIKNHASARLASGFTRLDGGSAAHYRRVISPPLKKLAVQASGPAMADLALERVRRWPRDRELPLTELTETLAVELASCLLFGGDQERATPIARMILKGLNSAWFLPTLGYLEWLRLAPLQERAIMDWAAERQAEPATGDLLSRLAKAPAAGGGPPNLERIAALLTFIFAAAFETCHKSIAWTLILLTQHPDIAAGLADEIETVVGDQPPRFEQISTLPLLDSVVKESMRLLPSVPLQFRVATRPTSLGGARFERSSRVCIATHLIARSPAIYDEPDRFLPERWSRTRPTPYEYPVFGGGGRMCPGSVFGMQMLKTCVAAIVASHRIELARGARIGYRTTVTCAPHGRVGVVFRDRSRPPVRSRLAGRAASLVSPRAAGG